MGCLSEVSIFLADTLKLVPMSITQTQPNIRDRGIFYQACEATRVYSFAEANNIIGMMKVFNKFEIFMLHSGNSQMTKNIKVELQKWTFEELFRKRNLMIYLTQSYKCDLDIFSTSSGMEDPALWEYISSYRDQGCQHSQSQVNQQISQFKTDLALSEIPFEITSLISRSQIALHTRKIPLSKVTL